MQTLDIRHRVPALLAIAAVVIIVVDLFSTPANAGRMPDATANVLTAVAPLPEPVKLAHAKAAPLLEDDPEFAPKFKQVVTRGSPARNRTATLFGRLFSSKQMGVHPALL